MSRDQKTSTKINSGVPPFRKQALCTAKTFAHKAPGVGNSFQTNREAKNCTLSSDRFGAPCAPRRALRLCFSRQQTTSWWFLIVESLFEGSARSCVHPLRERVSREGATPAEAAKPSRVGISVRFLSQPPQCIHNIEQGFLILLFVRSTEVSSDYLVTDECIAVSLTKCTQ